MYVSKYGIFLTPKCSEEDKWPQANSKWKNKIIICFTYEAGIRVPENHKSGRLGLWFSKRSWGLRRKQDLFCTVKQDILRKIKERQSLRRGSSREGFLHVSNIHTRVQWLWHPSGYWLPKWLLTTRLPEEVAVNEVSEFSDRQRNNVPAMKSPLPATPQNLRNLGVPGSGGHMKESWHENRYKDSLRGWNGARQCWETAQGL